MLPDEYNGVPSKAAAGTELNGPGPSAPSRIVTFLKSHNSQAWSGANNIRDPAMLIAPQLCRIDETSESHLAALLEALAPDSPRFARSHSYLNRVEVLDRLTHQAHVAP